MCSIRMLKNKIVYNYTAVCSDKGQDMSAVTECDSTSNFLHPYSLLNFNVCLFKTFTHIQYCQTKGSRTGLTWARTLQSQQTQNSNIKYREVLKWKYLVRAELGRKDLKIIFVDFDLSMIFFVL